MDLQDMASNPYAAPASNAQPVSVAEREIRAVTRVFRWLGWLGVLVYIPMIVRLAEVALGSAIAGGWRVSAWMVIPALVNGAIFSTFVCFLITASKLKRRRPEALTWASVLSCVMMIGFPLFTLIGFMCLRKLRGHYQTFCDPTSG